MVTSLLQPPLEDSVLNYPCNTAISPKPTTIELTAIEPTAIELTAIEPTAIELTAIELTAIEPTALDRFYCIFIVNVLLMGY